MTAVMRWLLLWILVFGAAGARAQSAAPDMPAIASDAVLPPTPAGFVRIEGDGVVWEYPGHTSSVVEPLFEVWREARPRVVSELGTEAMLRSRVIVRIGQNPEQMASLAPAAAPPPDYAVGVAYPALHLIVLTLTAPETWQRPAIDRVLVHELSHIELHDALQGREVPLWFIEGIAIHQARENTIERIQVLIDGVTRGRILPLAELDAAFPVQPHSVQLAYAQSADFVRWLLRRSAPPKLPRAIGYMQRGASFEAAVAQTWSLSLSQLEGEWTASLQHRFGALSLLAVSSAGWGLAALLVLPAWRRKRLKRDQILARWREEDAREAARAEAERVHALRVARARARWLAMQADLERQAAAPELRILSISDARPDPPSELGSDPTVH